MGWRNRHPAPRRHDYESEDEYQSALADWYDAEDGAGDEYVERKMEERYEARG